MSAFLAWGIALAFVLSIIWLFVWLIRSGEKLIAVQRARIANAKPGVAQITDIASTPVARSGTGDPLAKITMDVRPAEGAPYSVVTVWYIDKIATPRAQPGQEVSVKIDVDDRKVVYPAEAWAEYGWGFEKVVLLPKRF